MQPPERRRRTLTLLSDWQGLVDAAFEQLRAGEFSAERLSALDVLDGRSPQLCGRVLAYGEVGYASDRFSEAHDGGWVGRGANHEMQRPALRVEGGKLDRGAGARRDSDDVRRTEFELCALELHFGSPRWRDRVAGVRR